MRGTHVAATCVGQAKRLTAEAVRYARERRQFGKAIGEHQLVQAMLADMRAETYAAEAMVLDCARRFEQRPLPFADIACAKYFASEMVSRVADKAVQILGGQGYRPKTPSPASTATRGCSASSKAPRRSSSSRSPAPCCATGRRPEKRLPCGRSFRPDAPYRIAVRRPRRMKGADRTAFTRGRR